MRQIFFLKIGFFKLRYFLVNLSKKEEEPASFFAAKSGLKDYSRRIRSHF